MANLQSAPHLINKKADSGNFYLVPQDIADIVFQELGNSSAQLRVMIVLIGTKSGFGISQPWICERTGLAKESYIRARNALQKRGWLSYIETADKGNFIEINYDNIKRTGNTTSPVEKENSTGNTTSPLAGNTTSPVGGDTILPVGGNTTSPIIDNNINNNIENKPNKVEASPPPIVHDRAYFAWLMKHPSGIDDDYRAYLEREARN